MHRMLSIAAAAVSFAVVAAPAVAAPRPAAGTAQITSLVFTDARTAGGNTFLEGIESGFVTGTLSGTYVEHFRYVVHPNRNTSFHSDMTITGSVTGCGAGTVPFVLEGQGDAASTSGTQTAVGGAENTIGVRAEISFTALLATGQITYSGTYDCG